MRSRYTAREPERAHFVTSTIVDWLPVFHTAACCDILAGSLDVYRSLGRRPYAEGVPSLSPGLARGTSAYPG
jgi:hypothetical protein